LLKLNFGRYMHHTHCFDFSTLTNYETFEETAIIFENQLLAEYHIAKESWLDWPNRMMQS